RIFRTNYGTAYPWARWRGRARKSLRVGICHGAVPGGLPIGRDRFSDVVGTERNLDRYAMSGDGPRAGRGGRKGVAQVELRVSALHVGRAVPHHFLDREAIGGGLNENVEGNAVV